MVGAPRHRWWNVDIADRIAVLTFTRPPSNWMSIAAMTELADTLDEIAGRTSDVTVVVLTGGVDGYFIAHADLDDLASLGRGESVEGDPRAWRRALTPRRRCSPRNGPSSTACAFRSTRGFASSRASSAR